MKSSCMPSIRTKTENKTIGDLPARLTIDVIAGGATDTKIEIGGGTLCWVSGEKWQEFINELNKIINKYRYEES